GMFFVFFNFDFVVNIVYFSINTNTYVAFFFNFFNCFLMCSFFTRNYRRHNLNTCFFWVFEHTVYHLFDCLGSNFNAVVWTHWMPHSCIKQTQVIMYFCYCPNGRSRITASSFLIDRNSWA
ncbi:hypothetical protein NT06LI_2747, partial [Listeria innocua FSL J1-023]